MILFCFYLLFIQCCNVIELATRLYCAAVCFIVGYLLNQAFCCLFLRNLDVNWHVLSHDMIFCVHIVEIFPFTLSIHLFWERIEWSVAWMITCHWRQPSVQSDWRHGKGLVEAARSTHRTLERQEDKKTPRGHTADPRY